MADDIVLIKRADGALVPATQEDADRLGRWQVGEGVKVKATKVRARSLAHHRLFFALLNLTLDYWTPTGGTITPREKQFAYTLAKFLDHEIGGETIQQFIPYFLDDLAKSRADKLPPLDKELEALRKWVLEEAGYYDLVLTPKGIERRAVSISFARMNQEQFNELYKACFAVCWRLALSHPFESETQAQEAVDELLRMG